MNRVVAQGVKKSYKGRVVLELDLCLRSGQLYAVIGPNGSGKSTLLKLLAMIEAPDQGEIVYQNGSEALSVNRELRRRVVLSPDRRGLFNNTVYGNVAYGLRIRRLPNKEQAARIEKALRAVNLWAMRKENALFLSGGEAQRLCLAMVMAIDPEVVLLDEPTSSLDPGNVSMVEDIILAMKNKNRLIILVTHNLFQAKRLADRIVFLYQGRLLEESAASDFFPAPQSDLARRYISGEMVY